jgi:predicted ATP-binding protein involved in virulence
MRIETLELVNFRNFETAVFNFPTNFTVVIGENGKGKSSILQGLRVAAATFLLGIDEAERYHIQKEDVRRIDLQNRFVPQKGCSVAAHGQINGTTIAWKRKISTPNGRTDTKDAYDLIHIAEQLNNAVNQELKEDVDLPVINFFSTARLWVETKQTVKLKKKGSKLRDGYARCLDSKSDKKSPMEWIKSAYWKKLKDKPDSVLLDAVLEAIGICIPNWTPTEWDEDNDDLGGIFKDTEGNTSFIPLFYLSDGLRTMAAMVAEIAYRCVVLNPHLGKLAVKQTKGVVLIDEIDMHLHPKWQQCVVNDLKTAFPEIQFIATTHSPFIVQSLKAEELINLDRWTDVDPDRLTVDEVSKNIMGLVDEYGSESRKDESTSEEYLKLLDSSKKADLEDALTELESQVSDPAVRAFLKLQKLKKESSSDETNK